MGGLGFQGGGSSLNKLEPPLFFHNGQRPAKLEPERVSLYNQVSIPPWGSP
jgi:hypothetical protein